MRFVLKVFFAAIILVGVGMYVMPNNPIMADIRGALAELANQPVVQKTVGKAASYIARLDDASKITLIFLVISAVFIGAINMLFSLRAERRATRRWRNVAEERTKDTLKTRELMEALARVENRHAQDIGQMLRDNPAAVLDNLLQDARHQIGAVARIEEAAKMGSLLAKVARLREQQQELSARVEPISRAFGTASRDLSEIRSEMDDIGDSLDSIDDDGNGNNLSDAVTELEKSVASAGERLETVKAAEPRLTKVAELFKKIKEEVESFSDNNKDNLVGLLDEITDQQKEISEILDGLERGSDNSDYYLSDQVDEVEETAAKSISRLSDIAKDVGRLLKVAGRFAANGSGEPVASAPQPVETQAPASVQ